MCINVNTTKDTPIQRTRQQCIVFDDRFTSFLPIFCAIMADAAELIAASGRIANPLKLFTIPAAADAATPPALLMNVVKIKNEKFVPTI